MTTTNLMDQFAGVTVESKKAKSRKAKTNVEKMIPVRVAVVKGEKVLQGAYVSEGKLNWVPVTSGSRFNQSKAGIQDMQDFMKEHKGFDMVLFAQPDHNDGAKSNDIIVNREILADAKSLKAEVKRIDTEFTAKQEANVAKIREEVAAAKAE